MKKLSIIGGGAAGFFAAINIAERNKNIEITIIEKQQKCLQKVRISGGGRCNVTHFCSDIKLLTSHYPRGNKELYSIFSRFNVQDTVNWFNNHNVFLKTENDGRMFPNTNTSETIIECFYELIEKYNIKIKNNSSVINIKRSENQFTLDINNDEKLDSDYLLITTGGFNKIENYKIIADLGVNIIPPVPSLFTFHINDKNLQNLAGVSILCVELIFKTEKKKFNYNGPLLITHNGISGPATLRTSAWAAREMAELNYNFTLLINWVNDTHIEKLVQFINEIRNTNPNKLFINCHQFDISNRLWEYLCNKALINNEVKCAELSKKQINDFCMILKNDSYPVQGKSMFKDEFVSAGGVDLKEIDLKTMQSKTIPNLYFAGEVINVDGVTGGFNFQNAWSTSWIVASNF